MRSVAQEHGASRVSVAYRHLATGAEAFVAPDEVYHAASTVKVGVMCEVFRQASQGRFAMDDRVPVFNGFTSIYDGSSFHLAAKDDADPGLYEFVGQAVPIRELVRRMIVRSSNLATNVLLTHVSAASAHQFMIDLGAPSVVIRRGVEDGPAYRNGLNNATTARGLADLLTRVARHEVVSSTASQEMLDILAGQELNEGIPAGLPTGTVVAHKTGWNGPVYHDAGIVFPTSGDPFVLVVLTEGLSGVAEEDLTLAGEFVAQIARAGYEQPPG